MKRKIVHKESISAGKYQGKNDDDIFVGENYAAVIDGVSHKCSIMTDDGEIKIAKIITRAIQIIDGDRTGDFAKELNFDEFVRYINWYIKAYLEERGLGSSVGKVEATGIVFSKYQNQIWLVGDCRAIVDGKTYKNPLKIDDVYIDIRVQLVKALLHEGYNENDLEKNDISRKIIANPQLLEHFIKNKKTQEQIEEYRKKRIEKALLECGFMAEEIEKQDLIKKYYNPRDLQAVLKNNPNMGEYGYAIFNGMYTEQKNCRVIQLPEDAHIIKLFSDGFSTDALNNDKDIGFAIRKILNRAKNDPLSIGNNRATHPSKKHSKNRKERAIDDASAVIIELREIEKEQQSELEPESEPELEERG